MSDVTIGLANITVDGEEVPRQADAATLSIEPQFIDVDLYTAYNFDKRIDGYNVTVTIVCDEDSIEGYKLAIPGVEDTSTGGFQDGATHKSLRGSAKEIVIHPEEREASDQSMDVTIFKAIPTGSWERSYGKEKTQYEITLTALHNTGDRTQVGNYFRIGEPESAV
ncbi:hypothetical protein [Gracilibacillus saliphilus]|uniref:hypothetical protein n=1 Tax=Gracilibacillus saliphilus TaxID=543890 RepID=UPI0013D2B9AE|nr:hypothetical protein [Gracilibacillus saliphilus]